jgi:tetratricopeptide (TPR) repeat protein
MKTPANAQSRFSKFRGAAFFYLFLALALLFAAGCQSPSEAAYERGKTHYEAERYEEAIESWREAERLLREEGEDPGPAQEKIGTAYKELKRYDEAIEYLGKAIEANPRDLQRYRKLIRAHSENGDFDEARALCERLATDEALKREMQLHPKEAAKIDDACAKIDEDEQIAAAIATVNAESEAPKEITE